MDNDPFEAGDSKPFKVPQMPPVQKYRKKFIELKITDFSRVTLLLEGIDTISLYCDEGYFFLKVTRGSTPHVFKFYESFMAREAYDTLKGELNV